MQLKIDLLKQAAWLFIPAVLAWTLAWIGMDHFAARNLYPRPDALEYALSASSLLHGEGFALRLAGDAFYPPRYTPGYPFLLSGWYLIFGPHPENAYLLNLLLTGVLVATVGWVTYRLSGSQIGAFFSGLIAATSSALVLSAQGVRSDLSSCWFFLVGLYLLCIWETGDRAGGQPATSHRRPLLKALVAGGFLGWAVMIRPSFVFPLAGCLPWVLIGKREKLGARVGRLSMCLVGIGLGMVPMLTVNLLNLGNPLGNGYSLWVPDYCLSLRSAYSLENLKHSFDPARWQHPNLVIYSDLILGINHWTKAPFYGWAIWVGVIILLTGLRNLSREQKVFLLASVTSLLLLAGHYLLFFWQDERFLLLAIPLVAIPAGWGLSRICAFRPAFFRYSGMVLATVLMLGTIQPGVRAIRNSASRIKKVESSFSEIDHLRLIEPQIEENAIIVSVLDETLCEEYLVRGTERWHIPLALPNLGSHLLTVWQYNIPAIHSSNRPGTPPQPLFPLAGIGEDRLSVLRQALQQGRPVYLVRRGLEAYPREIGMLQAEFQLEIKGSDLIEVQSPPGQGISPENTGLRGH